MGSVTDRQRATVSAGPGDDAGAHFLTLQIGQTNVIGVHGRSVKAIETMLNNDMAPASLFDAAFLEVHPPTHLSTPPPQRD